MEGVSVGYSAERSILRGLDIRIDADDRIALLGANGNGKSTFAKLIAERLTAQRGSVTRAPGLKIAMFAQHQIDDLRPNETAVQHVRRFMPDAPEAKCAHASRRWACRPRRWTRWPTACRAARRRGS